MSGTQIQAFLQSIGHKFSVESGASQRAEGLLTAILYPHDLIHPWPRDFSYRIEFFTQHTDAAAVVPAINRLLGPKSREHVLSVFGDGGTEIEAAYGLSGYRLAWTNTLVSKKLPPVMTAPASTARIRPVATAQDVDAINALEPEHLSSVRAIDDPSLQDYVAETDGAIVAKAQMVTINDGIAYVSDMYTRPESRRKGLGSALLAHLHARAAALGKGQMILVPSLMTRQIRFYEKHGYREAVQMHLFIPGG